MSHRINTSLGWIHETCNEPCLTVEVCYIDVFWPCDGSIDDLEVFGLRLEVDLGTVSSSCCSCWVSPQWIGGHDPNNNNGWIEKDDEDEVEAEEEDEEEIEDEEMEVKDNDGENDDAEVYNPYEEADPFNSLPPSPETAEREIINAPVTQNTLQPIPPI
ncbi:hypothetical protein Tco_0688571 [Tanacetum coccineum]